MTKKAKSEPRPLPPDVIESDCKWPGEGEYLPWEEREKLNLRDTHQLTFYRVPNGRHAPEWVLCVLLISKARRGSDHADRFYAIGVSDGKIYTVGKGPHVTDEVTIHLNKSNVERFLKYHALYLKGLADAGSIRDRISTRRARGQQYRAEGRTSWMW